MSAPQTRLGLYRLRQISTTPAKLTPQSPWPGATPLGAPGLKWRTCVPCWVPLQRRLLVGGKRSALQQALSVGKQVASQRLELPLSAPSSQSTVALAWRWRTPRAEPCSFRLLEQGTKFSDLRINRASTDLPVFILKIFSDHKYIF
jgi:hypothetical protein